jgi:transcriptional regulator with XRE-family HTH domain
MAFKERLKEFIYAERLNNAKFAERIGVSRQNISQYTRGTLPNFDFFQKVVLKHQNIDLNWLISGKGSMYLKGKKEDESNNESMRANESLAHYNSKINKMNLEQIKWMQKKIDELLEENRKLNAQLRLNCIDEDLSKDVN